MIRLTKFLCLSFLFFLSCTSFSKIFWLISFNSIDLILTHNVSSPSSQIPHNIKCLNSLYLFLFSSCTFLNPQFLHFFLDLYIYVLSIFPFFPFFLFPLSSFSCFFLYLLFISPFSLSSFPCFFLSLFFLSFFPPFLSSSFPSFIFSSLSLPHVYFFFTYYLSYF